MCVPVEMVSAAMAPAGVTWKGISSLCPAASKPGWFYIGDATTITLYDSSSNGTALIAGKVGTFGCRDGGAEDAIFNGVYGVAATTIGAASGGEEFIYACDYFSSKLRCVKLIRSDPANKAPTSIDVKSCEVAGVSSPTQCVFDPVRPSVLYIACAKRLLSFDITSNATVTVIAAGSGGAPREFNPYSVACTGVGVVVMTDPAARAVYALDTRAGASAQLERLAGVDDSKKPSEEKSVDGNSLTTAKFDEPQCLCVVPPASLAAVTALGDKSSGDHVGVAYVTDQAAHRIRCVTLPPYFF